MMEIKWVDDDWEFNTHLTHGQMRVIIVSTKSQQIWRPHIGHSATQVLAGEPLNWPKLAR